MKAIYKMLRNFLVLCTKNSFSPFRSTLIMHMSPAFFFSYFLEYKPTSCPSATMCPFITLSISFFLEDGARFSFVSKAYTLKKYLCVPEGGHGPPYECFPKSFIPSVPGTLFSSILPSGGMFQTTQ